MGLLKQLSGIAAGIMHGLGKQTAPARQPRNPVPIFPSWSVNVPTWSDVNFANMVKEGFRKNAIIYACINAIAIAVSTPPLLAKEVKEDATEALDSKHPLQVLVDSPNPVDTQTLFMRRLAAHLLLGGAAYIHKWRTVGNAVYRLWLLPPYCVRPIPDALEGVWGYEYDMGGATFRIPASDIIYIKTVNPLNMLLGHSPITSAAREADTDNEATDFMMTILQNLAVPGGIIENDVMLSPESKAELKAVFEAKYTKENRGKTPVIDGGSKWKPMMMTPENIELGTLREVTESRICAVFGVPPQVIGAYAGLLHATYSNYQEAMLSFWDNTIYPLMTVISDELTRGLAGEWGEEYVYEFDLTETPGFAKRAVDKRDFALKALAATIFTRNQALAEMNLPLLPPAVGDVLVVPFNIMERSLTEKTVPVPVPPVEEPPPDEGAKAKKAETSTSTKTRREAMIKAANRRMIRADKWRPVFSQFFKNEFATERKETIGLVRKNVKAVNTEQLSEDLTKVGYGWKTRIIEGTRQIYGEEMKEGLEVTLEELSLTPSPGTFESMLADAVSANSLLCAERVNGVTLDTVRGLISDSIREQWNERQLAKAINASFEDADTNRAKAIAHTESVNAWNAASQVGYKSIGVITKEWLVTEDDALCPWCEQMKGKVVGIDQMFARDGGEITIGEGEAERRLKITRDTQHPPLHPSCRCDIIPGPEETIMLEE